MRTEASGKAPSQRDQAGQYVACMCVVCVGYPPALGYKAAAVGGQKMAQENCIVIDMVV